MMTRPQVIRADTIDLQDADAPSAKDHTRQPARPARLGEGSPAPHQAEALKHVELEISEQHGRSPRASADLSGKELQLLHDESETNGYQDPSENLLRNSTQHAAQENVDDGDDDDGLDDDLGDKISSSPSIGDDGGYPIPQLPWPSRHSSITTPPKKATHLPGPPSDDFSSSPFEETPTHYPLSFARGSGTTSPSKDHHQKGEYGNNHMSGVLVDEIDMEHREKLSHVSSASSLSERAQVFSDAPEYADKDFDPNDFHHLLLPDDDPLLDNGFDDARLESCGSDTSDTQSPASKASWDPDALNENTDDDSEDISFDPDSRFVDSGWGGECLREIEDIDFEFVYALHTFVATVEGQANATKGDTMVLLDDSNSYWWLVRVVKDSSIGYLPAEHIETPLERLARLNKHRNLDLSQTMLGDQDEDKRQNPLNPLRKAMRRRNVKKVEFSASNSFLEPSDILYSSDEEDDGDSELNGHDQSAEDQRQEQIHEEEKDATVAPLNTNDRAGNSRNATDARAQADRNGNDQTNGLEQGRDSDDLMDRNEDGSASKSRKGTVRNTDSFFKDDSVETRKISLTPNLLRDDSAAAAAQQQQVQQQQNEAVDTRLRASSFDSLEKDIPPDTKKDDKKKKEKRGKFGIFKRKDKKSKDKEKEGEESEKTSSELARKSPTPKESMESLASNNQSSPHRQTSKLQKQRPPNLSSPKGSYGPQNAAQRPVSAGQASASATDLDRKPSSAGSDMRLVLPESQPLFDRMPSPLQSKEHSPQDATPANSIKQAEPQRDRDVAAPTHPSNAQARVLDPPREIVTQPKPAPVETRPEATRQPQQRMRMDDFDSSSNSSVEQPVQRTLSHESQDRIQRTTSHESQQDRIQRTVSHESQDRLQRNVNNEPPQSWQRDLHPSNSDHHLALAQAAQHEPHPAPSHERLTDSPVHVSASSAPVTQERQTPHQPPPLVTDASSPSISSASPVSPPSSPELIDPPSSSTAEDISTPLKPTPSTTATTAPTNGDDITASPASTAPTNGTGRSLPAWNDASLRAYMDDDSEIRDLLIIVHDKTGVVARDDHPVVKEMYKEERSQLSKIERDLDGLLGDFYRRRKGRA